MIVTDRLESSRSKGVPQGPRLFSDFEKPAIDLLLYNNNQVFRILNSPFTGVTLAANFAKIGDQLREAIVTEFDFWETRIAIEAKVDWVSRISTTLTCTRTSPFTKNTIELRLPHYNACTYHLQSFHEYATLATSVPLINDAATETEFSTTVGTPHVAFGMGTNYHTASRQFGLYDAGVSITKPNCDASITLRDKADLLRASYVHYFDHERKLAAAATILRMFSIKKNSMIVGGSWIINDLTTIKARFDSRGILVTLLQQEIKSKSKITISSEFDTRALGNVPAIGFGLFLTF